MIRIAFVIDGIEMATAGTEGQLLMLASSLNKEKYSVVLICLRDSDWLHSHDLPFRVEVLSKGKFNKLTIVSIFFKLLKLLKRLEIDIVHAFYTESIVLGALLSIFARIPVLVASRRGFLNSEKPQRIKSFFIRMASRRFRTIICNSSALAQFVETYEGIAKEKISVIYNGYDFSRAAHTDSDAGWELLRRRGVEKDSIIICLVANLRPVKNAGFLIRAGHRIIAEYPRVHFVVIGEGSERPILERMIGELGLSGKFHLLGPLTAPGNVTANCHIGVLTSYSESLSNVLLEYSAMGLPVVASDVGGNGEVIKNEVSGFLFKADDIEDFVSKIKLLIDNSELRQMMGERGKKMVTAQFSKEKCIGAYETLYDHLLQHHEI
jgi:glycosyltransferase involved in cell wall biosynthesis